MQKSLLQDSASAIWHRWQPRERELPQTEIVLWTTPKEPPRALQTSECGELLDPTRASCMILAQRQPGKFNLHAELHCYHSIL